MGSQHGQCTARAGKRSTRIVVDIVHTGTQWLLRGKDLSLKAVPCNADPQMTFEIPGATLLVVDDDPSFRRALRRLLELERISVIEADDGERAIRVIDQDEPQVLDVVLTDVLMPTVSGTELVAVLRQHRPLLPVVAMTGWDPLPPGLPRMPVLHKPFELNELLETVGPLVLTPQALRRRARQVRADAAESRVLAEWQGAIARDQRAKSGELMKAFMQLRERMNRR